MKSLVQTIVVAAALTAPVVSFAQSNSHITRDQVRAELIQLEQAGYRVGVGDAYYPDAIQAAEARVSAQNSAATGYGGVSSGSSNARRGNPIFLATIPRHGQEL
ncbi:DUF4148 domain-containing protein [Paraburkholderia elongata]|uniref:DUF4148 domain-containing protein n=1 Tax=Paraburkholderia elongata TaxID=2675747 RepID=A0A972NIQ8_9BURK|nr:DUF4148 domain-containing protein [Paraburkholderia elongata]NPT53731.1 DUF4148 domain-containing protein [Paraburkholderia elongata]